MRSSRSSSLSAVDAFTLSDTVNLEANTALGNLEDFFSSRDLSSSKFRKALLHQRRQRVRGAEEYDEEPEYSGVSNAQFTAMCDRSHPLLRSGGEESDDAYEEHQKASRRVPLGSSSRTVGSDVVEEECLASTKDNVLCFVSTFRVPPEKIEVLFRNVSAVLKRAVSFRCRSHAFAEITVFDSNDMASDVNNDSHSPTLNDQAKPKSTFGGVVQVVPALIAKQIKLSPTTALLPSCGGCGGSSCCGSLEVNLKYCSLANAALATSIAIAFATYADERSPTSDSTAVLVMWLLVSLEYLLSVIWCFFLSRPIVKLLLTTFDFWFVAFWVVINTYCRTQHASFSAKDPRIFIAANCSYVLIQTLLCFLDAAAMLPRQWKGWFYLANASWHLYSYGSWWFQTYENNPVADLHVTIGSRISFPVALLAEAASAALMFCNLRLAARLLYQKLDLSIVGFAVNLVPHQRFEDDRPAFLRRFVRQLSRSSASESELGTMDASSRANYLSSAGGAGSAIHLMDANSRLNLQLSASPTLRGDGNINVTASSADVAMMLHVKLSMEKNHHSNKPASQTQQGRFVPTPDSASRPSPRRNTVLDRGGLPITTHVVTTTTSAPFLSVNGEDDENRHHATESEPLPSDNTAASSAREVAQGATCAVDDHPAVSKEDTREKSKDTAHTRVAMHNEKPTVVDSIPDDDFVVLHVDGSVPICTLDTCHCLENEDNVVERLQLAFKQYGGRLDAYATKYSTFFGHHQKTYVPKVCLQVYDPSPLIPWPAAFRVVSRWWFPNLFIGCLLITSLLIEFVMDDYVSLDSAGNVTAHVLCRLLPMFFAWCFILFGLSVTMALETLKTFDFYYLFVSFAIKIASIVYLSASDGHPTVFTAVHAMYFASIALFFGFLDCTIAPSVHRFHKGVIGLLLAVYSLYSMFGPLLTDAAMSRKRTGDVEVNLRFTIVSPNSLSHIADLSILILYIKVAVRTFIMKSSLVFSQIGAVDDETFVPGKYKPASSH